MGCAAGRPPHPPSPVVRHGNTTCFSHKGFVVDNPGRVTDFYQMVGGRLGEGSYGSVHRGVRKATGQPCAIKTVVKVRLCNVASFRREIEIMKEMDHPHIVKLYESFEDDRNIHLVMELCLGGELRDYLVRAGRLSEAGVSLVMQSLFHAVMYMHANNICHRDLKPENLMFATEDPLESNTLKVADFGLARNFSSGAGAVATVGTACYIAPEVLAGSYSFPADLWSCGVILYTLLYGQLPFVGKTSKEVLAKVRKGRFSFPADRQDISEGAKDLVGRLLRLQQKERFTAKEALEHPWIRSSAPDKVDFPVRPWMVHKLCTFHTQSKLKKAALHLIASSLGEQDVRELRVAFKALDSNGDGLVVADELSQGLAKAGFHQGPGDIQRIMEEVDLNGNGAIDYTEFLAATLTESTYMKEGLCTGAFRIFDQDGDGKLNAGELAGITDACPARPRHTSTPSTRLSHMGSKGRDKADSGEASSVSGGRSGGLRSRAWSSEEVLVEEGVLNEEQVHVEVGIADGAELDLSGFLELMRSRSNTDIHPTCFEL